jgi:hypothetical protein
MLEVIQWGSWGIIMAIVFSLIAKSRRNDLKINSSNILCLPSYVLIIGLSDFVFFLGIALISNIFPNDTATIGTTITFLGFSLLGLLLIYAFLIEKHSYDDMKIVYTKFNGKKTEIHWSNICNVKYQASMQWFVLESNDGKKSYYVTMLKGIKPFLEMLIKKLDSQKIDSNTFLVISKIQNGEVI